jgi:hypothetical protein
MKKLLTVLCGGLIALTLFVTTGNTVKAAEQTNPAEVNEPDDCACHDVTKILGAERNKTVSNLISSNQFKQVEKDLKKEGLKWKGANSIEVIKFNATGQILVGVPFSNKQGTVEMYIFINGVLVGHNPM